MTTTLEKGPLYRSSGNEMYLYKITGLGKPVPGTGTQNLCTLPSDHSGPHRCSAADVDAPVPA